MPNKRMLSSSSPLFQSQLTFFLFLAKLKKPILPLLLSLKKTRRPKKFKLLMHYSYYIKEYELSPSNTPLFQFYSYRKPKKPRLRFRKNINAYFNNISKCLGQGRARDDGDGQESSCKNENYCLSSSRELATATATDSWDYDEDAVIDSVDERAERFIQSFYEDMRRQQRLESHLHDHLISSILLE